ncbi:MAG: DUF2341 domain-containing protein [Planctomycetes bacterium]|nr:DUF2341 domain-containing protein [Planctomycetota bacterium]
MKKTVQNQKLQTELVKPLRFTNNLSPLTCIIYPVFCILFSALLFAETWQETTTADFVGGTVGNTQVATDSVQMAVQADWWNPVQNWWSPGANWLSAMSSWQYRKAITINNTGASALSDYQLKVENPVYNETGLVGSWHFEEGTGTNIADSSGNAGAGTMTIGGGGTQTASTQAWTNGASGKYGSAINFDGTDDSISTGSISNMNIIGEISVEAWIYPKTVSVSQQSISSRGGGWARAGWLLTLNNNVFRWHLGNGSSEAYFDTATTVTVNTCVHVVGLWRNGIMHVYINGVKDNNSANWAAGAVTNSYTHFLGRTDGGATFYFNGMIDEVRVYNRALAVDEISAHYNAKAKLNYGDIRFTGNSGTEFPYWMEKDGTFWVKAVGANSIPAGLSTVYMYYGNSGAAFGGNYANNGANTLNFYDNFDGTSLDTAVKWTVNTGAQSVANGELTTGASGTTYIRSQQTFGTGTAMRASVKVVSAGTADSGYVGYADGSGRPVGSISNNVATGYTYTSTTAGYIDSAVSTTAYTENAVVFPLNRSSYNTDEIRRISTTSIALYQQGNLVYTNTANIPSGSLPIVIGRLNTGTVMYDWVVVRNYVSPEPITFIGSEATPASQWTYRKAITINNVGSVLSDYQVKVENPVYDETGLAGSWHFDEGAGSTTADMSGYSNAGTLTNGPLWTTAGRADNGLSFDGTDDYVSIPDSTNWNLSTSWSVALWIKPADLVTSRVYYGRSADDILNGGENYLYYQTGAPVGISWGPVNAEWDTGVTLTVNQWQYIVMVYNSGLSRSYCYVDGQQRASVAVTSVGSSTGPLKIADNYNGNHFSGIMDEFRVYNRALSIDEIQARYNAKAKLNYSDIRFTGISGTEFPYWMEKDGMFWVRVGGANSIPAGLSQINMYYGNTSAGFVGNGLAVFDFFDDFEDGNVADWFKESSTISASTVDGNKGLYITIGGSSYKDVEAYKLVSLPSAHIIESRLKDVGGVQYPGGLVIVFQDINNWIGFEGDVTGNQWTERGENGGADTNWLNTYAPNIIPNTWQYQRMDFPNDGTYNVWIDRVYKAQKNVPAPAASFARNGIGFCKHTGYNNLFVDWVFVRKYTASEPVCSAGSEVTSASQWLYRRQLTVTNNSASSVLPANYTTGINMGLASLASAGKAQPDADDAVIVYKDPSSGNTYELDRTLATGKAIVFDGVDDYVTAPDSADWDLSSNDGTITFWVKPANLASAVAQGFFNQVNNDQNWCMYVYSTGSVGIGRAGINELVTPTGAIVNNIWQHISFVKSGSTTYIYINGVQSASGSITYWTNPTNPLKIGGHVYSSTNYFYNGAMDEAAFFRRALNTTEISELYNSGAPKPLPMTSVGADANLVAYFPFDGDCGDQSARGNNCTVVNGTYFGDGKAFLVPDLKQGAYFDGTNDYISIAHVSTLTFDKTNAFSLEAWIKTASAAGYPTIIRKAKSTANYEGYWFRLYNSTGKLSLQMYGTNGARLGRYGSTNLADNAWHHVAATYDGSSAEAGIKLYVDGAEQSYTADSTGTVDTMANTQPLVIGGDSNYWNGFIDDAAVYNRALLLSEISSAYNGGTGRRAFDVSISGIAGYWDLDGSCADKSGNNNTGSGNNGMFFNSGKLVTTGVNKILFKTTADVPASSSTSDFFIYYGNSSASASAANPNNVYLFQDDFSDGYFDTGKWALNTGSSVIEENGVLKVTNNGGTTPYSVYSKAYTVADAVVESRMRWVSTTGTEHMGFTVRGSVQALSRGGANNDFYLNDGSQKGTVTYDPPQNVWHFMSFAFNGATGKDYLTNLESNYYMTTLDVTNLAVTTSGSLGFLVWTSSTDWFEEIRVRKYSSKEPSVSFGTEQYPYQTTGTFTSSPKDTGGDNTWMDSTAWTVSGSGAIALQVRADNSDPSGWTSSVPAWEAVTNGDASVAATGRYLQYQASFSGGSGFSSAPVLTDVTITYTVPIVPPADSVSCDKLTNTWYSTALFTFTNTTGFGPQINKYYYVFDTNTSHVFDQTESMWNTGVLSIMASADGSHYLHYKPYSSTNTAGTAQDIGPFKYDGTAPASAVLLLPSNNDFIATSTTSFSWNGTTDLSGVTYTLQMDNYTAFSSPLVNITGMADTSYSLSGIGNEVLTGNTIYYWRVITVDGAANSSYPANPSYFKFTTTSAVPQMVNESTGESFADIQSAINSASTMDGDVIDVKDTIAHDENITISKDIILENALLAPSSGYAVTGQGSSGGEILRNCVITKGGILDLALGENLTIFNPNPAETIVITNSHLVNCLIGFGTDITNSTLENCDIAAVSDYFVGASTGDFRLKSTAVNAIDKGKNLSAEFTADIDGNVRNVDVLDITNFAVGAWDIGAYEFVLSAGYSDVTISVAEYPVADVSPSGFVFSAQNGTPITLISQTMVISKETSADFDWILQDDAYWLTLSPGTGTCGADASVTVVVDVSSLTTGIYEATITLTSDTAINSPLEIPVDVIIYANQDQAGYAVISTNLTSVDFYPPAGSEAKMSRQLTISNTGTADMAWILTEDIGWLTAGVLSGSLEPAGMQDIILTADITGLTAGIHSGTIVLTSAQAINSPVSIAVSADILEDTDDGQQAVVTLTVPSVPVLLSPSNGKGDLMTMPLLAWQNISGATYWMQIAKDMNFSVLAVNRVVETPQYQMTSMEEGVVYYWHIKAVNGAGMSEWSDTYWFKMQSSTAGDEETPKACFLKRLQIQRLEDSKIKRLKDCEDLKIRRCTD